MKVLFAFLALGCLALASACSTSSANLTAGGVQVPRSQLVQFQQALDVAQTVQGISPDRMTQIKTVDTWVTSKLASDTGDPVTITLVDALVLYADWQSGKLASPAAGS